MAMSCKVVQHMQWTLVQGELPALPDFASWASGEEFLLPLVYKTSKQLHVEQINDTQFQVKATGFIPVAENDSEEVLRF